MAILPGQEGQDQMPSGPDSAGRLDFGPPEEGERPSVAGRADW
jgi:hypothetical protein